jgi:hypothetical protein
VELDANGNPKPATPKPDDKPPVEPDPKKVTDADLDKAQAGMSIQAGTAFKIVRGELADARAALEAKEQEMTQLREQATKVDETELQTLRDQVKTYEEELSVIRIESTTDFKKTITQPLEAAKSGLKQLAGKYQINESDLQAALAEPDAAKRSDKLSALSENFNRLDTVRFDQLILETEQLEGKRAQMLGSASQKYQEMQQQREQAAREAEARFQQDWTRALDATLDKMTEEFAPIFKPTGDAKWDAKVQAAVEGVKGTDLTKMSNDDIAATFYKAGTFPLVLNLVTQLYAETEQLNATIDKLRGGTPPIGDGTPPAPPAPAAPAEGASFADVAKTKLAGVLPP